MFDSTLCFAAVVLLSVTPTFAGDDNHDAELQGIWIATSGTVSGEPGYTCVVGSYYSRPAGIPHGPLASKNGNVGLVHTDGLLGIEYRTDARSEDMIMHHLRSYPWA